MNFTDDAALREAEIRKLLPLVKTIARRVHRMVPTADVDDLIGDGSVGAVRAIDTYDASRGPTLDQYARHIISGAILNGLRRMDPVSERARRTVRLAERERYRIAIERGAMPTVAEMESAFPGYERAVHASKLGTPLSLDRPLPDGERLRRDWGDDPAAIVVQNETRDAVWTLLESLPRRQQQLMIAHYRANHSLHDIAREMRVTPQRVSQLHVTALERLRKADARAS
jgi:RNA polymerase sigma factor FliA